MEEIHVIIALAVRKARHFGVRNGLNTSMNDFEILGYFGAACINIAFVPQVWRLFRLKSAREISLPFTTLLIAGGCFWLSYGVLSSLPSVIVANIFAITLNVLMLTAKLLYGR